MVNKLLFGVIAIFCLNSCSNGDKCKDDKCLKNETANIKTNTMSDNTISAKNSNTDISCKLTTEELRVRKETVINSLKKQVVEKKELENGYSFKFAGSDKIIDELAEFVKTERSCCSFFVFNLSFSGDGTEAWLSLTGPEGTKEMISGELGL